TEQRRRATAVAASARQARAGSRIARWEQSESLWRRTIAYGTLSKPPQLRRNVDHRFTQTQKRYAADDLETMSEARNYQAHVSGLVRPHVGSHVLEVGCGIGTMTLQLLNHADRVVCIEPNLNCAARAREALAGTDRVTIRVCHLEECSRVELQQQQFD